jgi:hypothetical protein
MMERADPFTNADKPEIAVSFAKHLAKINELDEARGGDGTVALSSCAVAIRAEAVTGSDAAPSSRLSGSVLFSAPYAAQFLAACVEGVDYILEFTGTFSNGQKETIQVRCPCRDLT